MKSRKSDKSSIYSKKTSPEKKTSRTFIICGLICVVCLILDLYFLAGILG